MMFIYFFLSFIRSLALMSQDLALHSQLSSLRSQISTLSSQFLSLSPSQIFFHKKPHNLTNLQNASDLFVQCLAFDTIIHCNINCYMFLNPNRNISDTCNITIIISHISSITCHHLMQLVLIIYASERVTLHSNSTNTR